MKIRVYAHMTAERLYSVAIENGLSEEAANYFRYFNEVAIDLDVDRDTGNVENATIPWKNKTARPEFCSNCGNKL